jgi:hypothetical protein
VRKQAMGGRAGSRVVGKHRHLRQQVRIQHLHMWLGLAEEGGWGTCGVCTTWKSWKEVGLLLVRGGWWRDERMEVTIALPWQDGKAGVTDVRCVSPQGVKAAAMAAGLPAAPIPTMVPLLMGGPKQMVSLMHMLTGWKRPSQD